MRALSVTQKPSACEPGINGGLPPSRKPERFRASPVLVLARIQPPLRDKRNRFMDFIEVVDTIKKRGQAVPNYRLTINPHAKPPRYIHS